MVRSRRRRIYWDSCVWLRYINESPEDKSILDALLRHSSNPLGDIELITSIIAQTEVAFAISEQNRGALDPVIEQKIDSLWQDSRAVTLVEFYSLIAIEARNLIRLNIQRRWSLKPLDAVHLATARRMQVSEFHTYDEKLLRYSNQFGFPIVEPYISGGQSELF